jgi:hypothetical protein
MPLPPRHPRWLTLWFPLALGASAMIISAASVAGPIRDYRFQQRSRSTLLEIQRAVQDYHVALEFYPKKTPMTGAELVGLLTETGHLKAPPLNPWTGTAYAAGQPDGIRYRTDELAETYALEALGRDLAPERPLWQLDSTEHQSLE